MTDDNGYEGAEREQRRHEAAVDGLRQFANAYAPATEHDADTFFTTREICNAIRDHTGTGLEAAEVHELMKQMNFKDHPLRDMEMVWLLKSL